MLGKILFTIAVILVVALIWRTRRPTGQALSAEPRLVNPGRRSRWPIKGLATGAIALMLLASAYLLYQHYRDANEVIFIRVVDASSGRQAEYRATRGEIGDREFTTVDGRRIVLAETERLETSTIRAPSSTDQN